MSIICNMGKAKDNKKQKRDSLLLNSYRLFTTKGIADTSISEIADSSGVAKGTFYFYFKDKQDIINHLTARKSSVLLEKALKTLKEKEEKSSKLPVEEKIIILTDSIINDLEQNPRLVKFLDRNLNTGFYMKAFDDDTLIPGMSIQEEYYKIINSNGDKWKNAGLMLYTIIELISSTIHSVILEHIPCTIEEYKPYLFDCIRGIVREFRAS